MQLHSYQFNYRCATLHRCMQILQTCTYTGLWTGSESLRSAEWRFPHGAFCLCAFRNNHQLHFVLRPSPPSFPLPFIWQPHLFSLCWLIASLFHLAEHKRERGGREIYRDVRCLYADILTLEEWTKSVWKHEHYTRMRFLNISFLKNGHQYAAITASNSPGKISDFILEGVFFDSATRALLRWSTGLAHSPVIV